MAVRHPEVPCLRNWLISALRSSSASDQAEALAICEQMFLERPDYFFARTTLADLWLDGGELEKAAGLIFGPELVLTRLYPGREVFHISEIRHWAYLCARIKILQGEPEIAEGYRDMLEEIEPDSQPVRQLNEMLEGGGEKRMPAKLIDAFKKLFEQAKANEEKSKQRRMKKASLPDLKKTMTNLSDRASQKKPVNPDQMNLFGDS